MLVAVGFMLSLRNEGIQNPSQCLIELEVAAPENGKRLESNFLESDFAYVNGNGNAVSVQEEKQGPFVYASGQHNITLDGCNNEIRAGYNDTLQCNNGEGHNDSTCGYGLRSTIVQVVGDKMYIVNDTQDQDRPNGDENRPCGYRSTIGGYGSTIRGVPFSAQEELPISD